MITGQMRYFRMLTNAVAGGALVSTYHVALEWFPALDSGACSATTPCPAMNR